MKLSLTKYDCRFGAPMGRPTIIKNENTNAKFYLERLKFIDGYYDLGGAYFGLPANVYRAVSGNHELIKNEYWFKHVNHVRCSPYDTKNRYKRIFEKSQKMQREIL